MAITLNGQNPKIGFKYATDNNSIGKDTMTIAKNGKLLFNGTRLGLTSAENDYLTDAVNKQLLTNASISLTASNNPYEVLNGAIKSSITFTLTLKVNNTNTDIVNEAGNKLNTIHITLTTSDNKTVIVPLAYSNKTYTKTIKMNNGLSANNNNGAIANFVKGSCYISDSIYCKITKDDEIYILPLTKPSISVSQGGLVYYGVTDRNYYNPSTEIIGASAFVDYVSSSSKGSLTLALGTFNDQGIFEISTQNNGSPAKLTCLNLLSSVSNQTIKLNPISNSGYYGIIVLPNNINLGKFATGIKDDIVINGNIYNATNTSNNMDSPFVLLTSTTFNKCITNENNLKISSKEVTYNIYRTKNKLIDAITIKL